MHRRPSAARRQRSVAAVVGASTHRRQDKDADPQQGIMDMMKKLYDEGDDDMKVCGCAARACPNPAAHHRRDMDQEPRKGHVAGACEIHSNHRICGAYSFFLRKAQPAGRVSRVAKK